MPICQFGKICRFTCQFADSAISPHYRSEGRRQVSGGFFGGIMALSEDYRNKCHRNIIYIGENPEIWLSIEA